ncbi:MAG TPA: nuclear transport factor 2 family protein [Pirellulales bacterium]|jgi:hypothetical protein|nr:nuclear transport factor 2 family protein [Pirellulales bacterium]
MVDDVTVGVLAPAWGHRHQFIELAPPQPAADQSALDHLLIAETLHRYAWAFDEHQREALGACFTESGRFVGSVGGWENVGPFEGRTAIVDWLGGAMAVQRHQRRHNISNLVVNAQTPTSAVVLAFLCMTAVEGSGINVVTAGFYRADMVKDAGVWRIKELFAGFDRPFAVPDEAFEPGAANQGVAQ